MLLYSGLLGTNNDQTSDDITLPDGTIHSPGIASTEQQLFEYGKLC